MCFQWSSVLLSPPPQGADSAPPDRDRSNQAWFVGWQIAIVSPALRVHCRSVEKVDYLPGSSLETRVRWKKRGHWTSWPFGLIGYPVICLALSHASALNIRINLSHLKATCFRPLSTSVSSPPSLLTYRTLKLAPAIKYRDSAAHLSSSFAHRP